MRRSNSARVFRRVLRSAAVAALCLASTSAAYAQDDGARLYMMVPDQTTIASLRVHLLHSNLAVDPGSVVEKATISTPRSASSSSSRR